MSLRNVFHAPSAQYRAVCDGQPLVLPPQTCRECKGSGIGPDHVGYVTTCGYRRQFEDSGEIMLGWTCPEHLFDCPSARFVDDGPCKPCNGTGLVPPVLHDEPCPDPLCVMGTWLDPGTDLDGLTCMRCDGTGRVTSLWVAVEQQRISIDDAWSDWQRPFPGDDGSTLVVLGSVSRSERRLAVVSVLGNIQAVLPVVDRLGVTRDDSYIWIGRRSVQLIDRSTDTAIDLTAEPWAQGLVPGSVVVHGWTLRHLNEPIAWTLDPSSTATHVGYDRGEPESPARRVPLSVPEGAFVQVELP